MTKKLDNNQKSVIPKSKKIKISYARIYLELEPAIALIGDMKGVKNIDVTMNIVKTLNNIGSALDVFSKTRKKITEDNAQRDKDGRFVTRLTVQRDARTGNEKQVEVFVYDEAVQKEVNWQLQKLDEKEVELEIFPINYTDIKDCENLTPNILKASGEFVIL